MSIIYSLGDRVLVAGVNSRATGGSLSPLHNDNRSPVGLRIHEALVTGVASHDTARTGDHPHRGGVLFIQYNGSDGAPRNLDYPLWMIQERDFRERVLRTLGRIMGLTPEQQQMLLYYSIPRPIASVAYTHMLRDLAALVSTNAGTPSIVINDKDAVFNRAAAIGIPVYSCDMYRGVTAEVEEPENMDDISGLVSPSPQTQPVYVAFDEEAYPPENMPTSAGRRPAFSSTTSEWMTNAFTPAQASDIGVAEPVPEPSENPEDDFPEVDDSWMNDDPLEEDDT